MTAIADKPDEEFNQVELVSSQDTGVLSKEDAMARKVEHRNDVEVANINEKKTLRKIDLRVVPMVTTLNLLSWLDRGFVVYVARYGILLTLI